MISIITPTHNNKWLKALWESIKKQTFKDWEWVLVPNGGLVNYTAKDLVGEDDPRIIVVPYNGNRKIGAVKNFAFSRGRGDLLVEADHDDLLEPTCLEELAKVDADFVYSDCADFSPTGAQVTYHHPDVKAAWLESGWRFREDGSPISWEPSAAALSLVYFAPNHVRAWKREFYHRIGGHNKDFEVCDDHELLIRTYLSGKMVRIPKVLYRYRVETNTWSGKIDKIRELTYGLRDKYLHSLVERECQLKGLPLYDLGGAFDAPKGWKTVDKSGGDITADLCGKWPFKDGSVGAFRAFDLLEHLPDKIHTMSEIYRCLAPGGWLLSATPSALGEGAWCDPTHVSAWVCRSFRYYTDRSLAQYIHNEKERFMEVRLFQTTGEIPYVIADLLKLDGEIDSSIPYIKRI